MLTRTGHRLREGENRMDRKSIKVWVEKDQWISLKYYAIENGCTMSDVVRGLIDSKVVGFVKTSLGPS